jgi:hypothetical protein
MERLPASKSQFKVGKLVVMLRHKQDHEMGARVCAIRITNDTYFCSSKHTIFRSNLAFHNM